jgi:hypothetical protein
MLNLTGVGGQARLEKELSTDGSDDTDGRASPPGEMSTDDIGGIRPSWMKS